jgi:hypothetical protein
MFCDFRAHAPLSLERNVSLELAREFKLVALAEAAAPGTCLQGLYRTDPELTHALIDVGPRLTRILVVLLTGFVGAHGEPRMRNLLKPTQGLAHALSLHHH